MQACLAPLSQTRRDLLEDRSAPMQRRRAFIALSLVGMVPMALVALRQTGLLRHLPEPPLAGFDSDKVNTSSEGFPMGSQDGTLAVAAVGRARRVPLLNRALGAKAAVDAGPPREHAWCAGCVAGALITVAILWACAPEALAR